MPNLDTIGIQRVQGKRNAYRVVDRRRGEQSYPVATVRYAVHTVEVLTGDLGDIPLALVFLRIHARYYC